MIEKLKTLIWFARRPSYWAHAKELFMRKFRKNLDSPAEVKKASEWASARSCSATEALNRLGLLPDGETIPEFDETIVEEGRRLAKSSAIEMGGAGDLELLYAAASLSKAEKVIETGVAYGWSSLAILSAIGDKRGRLVSVDMPYPKVNNEDFVGIVVPERLRENWISVRQPD